MAVITITSDYGLKDHYVAALKGALHRELDHPQIVDITHEIQAFNITEAAFILRNAYHHFPKGSIHLVCVDEEALPDRPHVAVRINEHIFIAADNGLLSMVSPGYKPDSIHAIDFRNSPELTSARDIFARAAGHLARGGKLDLLGRAITTIKTMQVPNPVVRESGNYLVGSVIHIDRFGNLVTNLSKKFVMEHAKGRQPRIILLKNRQISRILDHYNQETEAGKAIAIFNAADLLEIAIFRSGTDTHGGARELLGMRVNDAVNIEFR